MISQPALSPLVTEYVEKRWEPLANYETIKTVPLKKGQNQAHLVQAIYAKLTSHQFCRQRPADVGSFISVIEHAMSLQQPIPCILGHGPLKNPNNCSHPHADWSEFFAYSQLMRLAGAIKALYEPGIEVSLYMDDARAAHANNVPAGLMDAYRLSVQEMVSDTPLRSVIKDVVSLKELYASFDHSACLDEAAFYVQEWQKNPENQEKLQEQILHAARNMPNADTWDEAERWEEARRATYRYLHFYEAEKLCGIWNQPNKLYMRYSPHTGFYQVFTLRKGSVSQPWQGQGALIMLSEDKPDPLIMTRQKANRYRILDCVRIEHSVPYLRFLPVFEECPASRVQEGQSSEKPLMAYSA